MITYLIYYLSTKCPSCFEEHVLIPCFQCFNRSCLDCSKECVFCECELCFGIDENCCCNIW